VAIYQIGVQMLSEDHPYPPGGPANGELFVSACLAAAESKFLDSDVGDKQQGFQMALQAAIALDLRRQPRNLGYSHGRLWGGRRRQYDRVTRVHNLRWRN